MGIRIERINSLIQEELSQLIREEIPPDQYGWISITGVKTAPDLSEAHVFITVFPEHLEGKALEKLNKMGGYLRRYLSKRIRAKTVPRLRFEIDNLTKLVEKGVIEPPEVG
jgi:ribosome-binding factor A